MLERIKKLEYQIMDEVSGAEDYMICSEKWKNLDLEVSKKYKEMASQEIKHAEELHKMLLDLKKSDISKEDHYLIDFLADVNVEQIKRVSQN